MILVGRHPLQSSSPAIIPHLGMKDKLRLIILTYTTNIVWVMSSKFAVLNANRHGAMRRHRRRPRLVIFPTTVAMLIRPVVAVAAMTSNATTMGGTIGGGRGIRR